MTDTGRRGERGRRGQDAAAKEFSQDGRCCEGRVARGLLEEISMSRRRNRLDAGQLRPCRTADSIFTVPLGPPVPLARCLSLSLSFFPTSKTRIRAYNYRRHASPWTLFSRGPRSPLLSSPSPHLRPPIPRPSPPTVLSLSCLSCFLLPGSLILGRNLDLPWTYWAPIHGLDLALGGATVLHYHTIFMLAPPGPQSRTTAHYARA